MAAVGLTLFSSVPAAHGAIVHVTDDGQERILHYDAAAGERNSPSVSERRWAAGFVTFEENQPLLLAGQGCESLGP